MFLDKNLTEWKKPYLADHFEDGKDEAEKEAAAAPAPKGKKGKLAKHTTMKGTAKVQCTAPDILLVCPEKCSFVA